MDLMQMGTQLLASKLSSGANSGAITSALGGLLSGGGGSLLGGAGGLPGMAKKFF